MIRDRRAIAPSHRSPPPGELCPVFEQRRAQLFHAGIPAVQRQLRQLWLASQLRRLVGVGSSYAGMLMGVARSRLRTVHALVLAALSSNKGRMNAARSS